MVFPTKPQSYPLSHHKSFPRHYPLLARGSIFFRINGLRVLIQDFLNTITVRNPKLCGIVHFAYSPAYGFTHRFIRHAGSSMKNQWDRDYLTNFRQTLLIQFRLSLI